MKKFNFTVTAKSQIDFEVSAESSDEALRKMRNFCAVNLSEDLYNEMFESPDNYPLPKEIGNSLGEFEIKE